MMQGRGPTKKREGYGTVSEVAAHLRLSEMTIYRMVKDGRLVSAKFGRARRILWRAVEELEASCQVASVARS